MTRRSLFVILISGCLILALGAAATASSATGAKDPPKKPKPAAKPAPPPAPPAPPAAPTPAAAPAPPQPGPPPEAPAPMPSPAAAPAPAALPAPPAPPIPAGTPAPAPQAPEQPLPPPPPVEEEPDWVTDVIAVQNVDVRSLAQALAIFNARILPNPDLRILAVKASPETLQAIRETVQRLDQAAPAFRNVEITAYLLQASPAPGGGGELPAAIQKVVGSLQASLGYPSVRLLESLVLRCRDDREWCSVSGVLPSDSLEGPETQYNLRCRLLTRGAGAGQARSIQLENLDLGVRFPVPAGPVPEKGPRPNYSFRDAGFETSLDLKDGQTAVVGKATVSGSRDALILVVSARITD